MKSYSAVFGTDWCAPRRAAKPIPPITQRLPAPAAWHPAMDLDMGHGVSVRFSTHLAALAEDWAVAAPADNVFLQLPYLAALANCPPKDMSFGYLVCSRHGRPVGVALLQRLPFRAEESLKPQQGTLAHWLARRLSFQLLVCGNMLLSGHHGCHAAEGCEEECLRAFAQAITQLRQEGHLPADATLWKDLQGPAVAAADQVLRPAHKAVCFQPAMSMALDSRWHTFEDYMEALTSKYRVRTRRTLKKAQALTRRTLTAADIVEAQARLYTLYLEVAQRNGFNALTLHPGYFAALQRALGERFHLLGYYDASGQMVGFCTMIANGPEMEAHFLGFEEAANTRHHLYHNMLYDLIRQAIRTPGVQRIAFARTAEEIKSSVGATPHDPQCYFRHDNLLIQAAARPLFRRLAPQEAWVARHPFGREGDGE